MKGSTSISFVEKAKNIHDNKYDYSLIDYKNSHTKVIIICKKHGQFEQRPDAHLTGQGCILCSIDSTKLGKEKFIEKSNKIHSNKYDYSLVKYKNNYTEIIIICKEHGEFEQRPNDHLKGSGCPICSGNVLLGKEKFIKKAQNIHNNKYDYSLVKYKNNHTNVIIICKEHGQFEQRPQHHLNGSVCPVCSRNSSKLGKEKFIERGQNTHGNKYDYSLIEYKNAHTKVIIICKEHGEFQQEPDSHLNGKGCPRCTNTISKAEVEWLDYLNVPKENRQKTIYINGKKYRPDAIDKENKIIWEFYGDYWHGNPKIYKSEKINTKNKKTFGLLYKNTIEKEQELIAAGYKIISIWENEWNKTKNTFTKY